MREIALRIEQLLSSEKLAEQIGQQWQTLDEQRQGKLSEWEELDSYLYATDTSTTSNANGGWMNSTTLPKLCQIMDNLHANYNSALFPNNSWLRWEGYTRDADLKEVRGIIEAYMQAKTRDPRFRTTVEALLYDYICRGVAFSMPEWVSEVKVDPATEEVIPGFVGPAAVRISPYDIVFDPTATDFYSTYKIIRKVITLGTAQSIADKDHEGDFAKALAKHNELRSIMGQISPSDIPKLQSMLKAGYGSIERYRGSQTIEILEYWGDIVDADTGEVLRNQRIQVMDRTCVVYKGEWESWLSHAPIYMVGWRPRPDNLWAMGPLDNLVGLQYRIDHLENSKANALDLLVHPPKKIIGDVQDFEWAPGAEIHIGDDGDVIEMGTTLAGVIQADNNIALIESRMEQYAGAPREAMGFRTPGEKTKFEVQQLMTASTRIFQDKITRFEVMLLEPLLNSMLELARRKMDTGEIIRTLDTELGVSSFSEISKENLTASGKIMPIGARHFAEQSVLIQDLAGLTNTGLWAKIEPHISSVELAALVENTLALDRYKGVISDYAAVDDKVEMDKRMAEAQQEVGEYNETPAPQEYLGE